MKKLSTFIFAALLAVCCWGTEVTIGSGSDSSEKLPTSPDKKYSITQFIYLASEIGSVTEKSISKIAFNAASTSAAYTRNLTIYIEHTKATTLSGWNNVTSSALFTGNVEIPAAGGWYTITLTNSFTWNGIDNLLISIADNTNRTDGQFGSYKKHYTYNSSSYDRAYGSGGTSAYNPASFSGYATSRAGVPQIKITFSSNTPTTPTLTVPSSANLGTFDVQYEQVSTSFVVKGNDLTNDVNISTESTDITVSPTSITKEAIAAAGSTGVEVTITNKSTFDFKKSHKVTVASTGATSQDVSISGSAAQYTAQSSYTYLYNTEVGSYSTLAGPTEIASVDASAQTFVLGTTSNACTIDYSAVPGTYVALGKVSNLKVKKTGTGTFKAFAFDYSATSITIDETKGNNQITYGTTANVTLNRTLVADGYYSTICLPFAVSAEQITNQFGAGTIVQELSSASLSDNDTELTLTFDSVTTMEAGKPYLIKPTKSGSSFTFNSVTLDNTDNSFKSTNLDFIGKFNQSILEVGNKNTLLLGGNNELGWANASGTFKGLRAYFLVKYHGAAAPERLNTRMIFNNATKIQEIQSNATPMSDVRKLMNNGQLVIIRNGVKYNAQGARL